MRIVDDDARDLAWSFRGLRDPVKLFQAEQGEQSYLEDESRGGRDERGHGKEQSP
jgi:hypothetical protein